MHLLTRYRVLMKGITWSRDSHGLFDYESRHLTKKTMKTQQAVQVVRVQNELQLNPIEQEKPPTDIGEDSKPLLNILCEDGKDSGINRGVDSFYLECCTNQLSKQEKRELNE